MHAILDTSVLISALLGGWWRRIAEGVEGGALSLVASPDLIDEFTEVVARPYFERLIHADDAMAVADLLRRAALHKPIHVKLVCRDPSDDYLLALAEVSTAEVLVTRDEDLLVIGKYGRTAMIHVAEFLARIERELQRTKPSL
ncbi:MAG: putative toxin-antitoxin system toxin component, PIN family [Phycisphaerales bacterium]|nr:putative toxin-antitoxin system toxin component, PIN family [Phycisphaerales bacterium]